MRLRFLLTLAFLASPALAQQPAPAPAPESNPFFVEWTTPFGVPPFDKIKDDHFLPAIKEGIARKRAEVEAIANASEPPTFANTIAAVDRSGEFLDKVNSVFRSLVSAETNDRLQAISRETAPMLAALQDDIFLNEKLFARVKAVYEQRDRSKLTPEQTKLLTDAYRDFVRGGANLDAAKKERFRKINADLAVLGVKFSDNLLKQTNAYRLVIEKKEDLSGLPDRVVEGAAEAAKAADLPGKWVFTLQSPSIWPFLQFADNRELRKQILTAYITRCDHGDDADNKVTLSRIAALRAERAQMLGYPTHADYTLEDNMAKTPDKVFGLLNQIWTPALVVARKEAADQQAMIKADGEDFALEPWDWRYYTEKIRKARYDLDEQALRAYFKLDNVREGAFYVATKLYGLTFIERKDLPVYHPEVKTFEVKDADGSHLGVFYVDYHPRPGKRGGAWSGRLRQQWIKDGKDIRPIVTNVGNFSRPTADAPALLSLEEVETLFHELGHGLHSLLSRIEYRGLASVPRDFVELPSQIMENWAAEPEVLKMYAKHFETGEPIPDELIEKIKNSSKFNQGFTTVEYLAASFLDMDWHTLADPNELDPIAFENQSMNKIGLIPEIVVRYRSPYFRHIFAGGYSAGYYSYIWAEVLDADAFQAFKETSLFDQKTAKAFRENILARGGTEDPMVLYKQFRGAEPKIDALLQKRGLM